MFSPMPTTERAIRSVGRVSGRVRPGSIPTPCGVIATAGTATFATATAETTGIWYLANPAALRHDTKLGGPRGTS